MTNGIAAPPALPSGGARAEPCVPRGVRSGDPAPLVGSLDQAVGLAWAALARGYPVACPVCDGVMRPQPDSSAARCESCGSALS